MLDFLFEHSYVLLIFAGVVAQWIKSRNEAKEEARQLEERLRRRKAAETTLSDSPSVPTEKTAAKSRQKAPRAVPPPLSSADSSPTLKEVAGKMSSELARQAAIKEKMQALEVAKKRSRETYREIQEKSRKVKPAISAQADLGSGLSLSARLKNRHELRRAIVLKEILDKPIALRHPH